MTVYLVGAGPGDPGLLTLRGAEVLAEADVVVYDRLSGVELLDLAPASAERINVGKIAGGPSVPQDEINALLIQHGGRGREVVRLKGGDPFVFARGAEEAAALAAAGIRYEVVPGITSAIAVPAYAGIPVTLRYSSTNFTVVTGHEDPSKGRTDVDWESVARVGGTIVILMGVAHLQEISARLIAGGLPGDTPAAAVRWGTRPEQQTTRATLATLPTMALRAPSVIVVGEVAREDLNWFETRPLFGLTAVVTRTRSQASALSSQLRREGATVIEIPTIAVTDPTDGGAGLDAAVARIHEYDWVVLTSPNAARRFCSRLRDGRDLAGVRIAVVGPSTGQVLANHHLVADLMPEQFVAESLLEAFPDPHGNSRVLLPRAAVARDTLPDGLRARGWQVDIAEAYRTEPAVLSAADRSAISAADVITFTSSSTVTNFVAAAGVDSAPPAVAVIGPVTAATASESGLEVTVEAAQHTVTGLVDAIVAWATGR